MHKKVDLAVDAFCLVLDALGFGYIGEDISTTIAKALYEYDLEHVDELLEKLTHNHSKYNKCKYIAEIFYFVIDHYGMWKAIKLMWSKMSFLQKLWHGAKLAAEITAAVATDGISLVIELYAVVEDIDNLIEDIKAYKKDCLN